jgi:hypothetical protein
VHQLLPNAYLPTDSICSSSAPRGHLLPVSTGEGSKEGGALAREARGPGRWAWQTCDLRAIRLCRLAAGSHIPLGHGDAAQARCLVRQDRKLFEPTGGLQPLETFGDQRLQPNRAGRRPIPSNTRMQRTSSRVIPINCSSGISQLPLCGRSPACSVMVVPPIKQRWAATSSMPDRRRASRSVCCGRESRR